MKRYEPVTRLTLDEEFEPDMAESPDGEYVRYDSTQSAIDAALCKVRAHLVDTLSVEYLEAEGIVNCHLGRNPLAELQAIIDAQSREIEELRKDAERWKHARNDPRVAAAYCNSAMAPGHRVDEAIDAAMQEG